MNAELTIDADALRRNVTVLRALARPARYAAVVKANAYGHGLVASALALAPVVDAFCVYRADEALALRAAGIATPLLILGPVEPADLAAVHAAGVALTLWSEGAFLRDVARTAARKGTPYPVHVKIDTGVTRLGLDASRAAAVLATYLAANYLVVQGVYTHLAAAEELQSAYTLGQLARFEEALSPVAPQLTERGVIRHAAASAAAMLFPQLRLDMIRAGIATYGIWPSLETRETAGTLIELEPALGWTTELVVVRDLPAGRSVGYGCTFVTGRASRIGVLPIGYAEGLPRALSNAGCALVDGRRVPFVGRVCMNMSFVDVTDAANARPGSRVTLIGRDGDEWLDANELAAAAGTIGYELVARLPSEMRRRYVEASAAIASRTSSVPS